MYCHSKNKILTTLKVVPRITIYVCQMYGSTKCQRSSQEGFFNYIVAWKLRPFVAIATQSFLAKLVFQLGHFAPKLFAHFLYSTIHWSCKVGAKLLVALIFL